MSEVGTHTFI
jgi:hypothetical protein